MNICLVSSAKSAGDLPPGVMNNLAELGVRVVVVCLQPQQRHLWNRGTVVFYAPKSTAAGLFTAPLETLYRRKLDQVRPLWLRPLNQQSGKGARLGKALERRGYQVLRVLGSASAGRLEAAIAGVRSKLGTAMPVAPFEKIPEGLGAYGVVQALDQASAAEAKTAAESCGAIYLGPGIHGKEVYEQAILHYLRA